MKFQNNDFLYVYIFHIPEIGEEFIMNRTCNICITYCISELFLKVNCKGIYIYNGYTVIILYFNFGCFYFNEILIIHQISSLGTLK